MLSGEVTRNLDVNQQNQAATARARPRDALRGLAALAYDKPSKLLSFPKPLEARFEADTKAWRLPNLRVFGTAAALIFSLFLFTDLQLAPEIRDRTINLRLVASVLLFFAFQIAGISGLSAGLREAITGATPLLASCCLLMMFEIDPDPVDRVLQITGIIGILFYGMIVVPSLFRHVLVSIPLALAVTEAVLMTSSLSLHVRLCDGTMLVFLVFMGLIAKHRMEHQQRREYLRGLLASLRYDDLVSDTDTLRILAEEDGLTGLLNRRAINVRLARTITHCRENGSLVGVMLIDVDFFKMYNDVYGHVAGDACLRNVAQIVKGQFRAEDIVGRYGGEEFIVVVRDPSPQACSQLAERVRRAIEAAGISAPGPLGCLTASFGIACVVPGPDCTVETLLELADQQLYAAKRGGRNRVSPPPRELV